MRTVPYPTAFAATSGVSASAWIEAAAMHDAPQCIAGKRVETGIYNSWQLCLSRGLSLLACVGTTSASGGALAGTIRIGTFHHVAMTFDGARMRAWRDGAPVIDEARAPEQDDNPVRIGTDLDAGALNGPFDGAIDDVRIWNVTLAPGAIEALAQP